MVINNNKEILIVTVGTPRRPASAEDIQNMIDCLAEQKKNSQMALVTHEAVSFIQLKADKQYIYSLGSSEYPATEDHIQSFIDTIKNISSEFGGTIVLDGKLELHISEIHIPEGPITGLLQPACI